MRLAIVILALALAACGPSDPPAQSKAPPTAPESQLSNEAKQAEVAALPSPYNEASYEAGRRVFAQCASCHTTAEGAPNRVGPNLHGIFGREAGAVEGFAYSQALQDANFVWDPAQLEHWLENPRTFLPGNRMAFVGVRDAEQRRDVIAYLMVETR